MVADWWQTRFPSSAVTLVNAGIGATGSDIGTFRVKKDVIEKDPDFVVVEFAVNDAGLKQRYVRKDDGRRPPPVARGHQQDRSYVAAA